MNQPQIQAEFHQQLSMTQYQFGYTKSKYQIKDPCSKGVYVRKEFMSGALVTRKQNFTIHLRIMLERTGAVCGGAIVTRKQGAVGKPVWLTAGHQYPVFR